MLHEISLQWEKENLLATDWEVLSNKNFPMRIKKGHYQTESYRAIKLLNFGKVPCLSLTFFTYLKKILLQSGNATSPYMNMA